MAEIDAAGNIKPSREKSSDKIDGIAAWCDALFAWAAAPPDEAEYMDSAWDTPHSIVL